MKFPSGTIIYGISDSGYKHWDYFKELIEADIDVIQLRDKELSDREFEEVAFSLRKLTADSGKIFIINDRVDVALTVDADGVHLGNRDLSLKSVRRIIGEDKIIGYSCHSFEEAKFASAEGANYISVGPIFRTPRKKELAPISSYEIELIRKEIKLPQIAIGGINLENIQEVKGLGFKGVAMISALANSKDKKKLISEMRRILEK